MASKEAELLFKADKSRWFTTDYAGYQSWDNDLVKDFWEKIRTEKLDANDFEFENYIFPAFEDISHLDKESRRMTNRSFLSKNEPSVINSSLYFDSCTFLGFVDFSRITFSRIIRFTNVKFLNEVSFNFSIFNDDVSFSRSKFFNNTFFFKTKFKKETYFYKTEFIGNIRFMHSEFNVTVFKEAIYDRGELVFEKVKSDNFPSITFMNSTLNKNVIFRKAYMKNVSFVDSEIVEAKFINCNWSNSERLILNSENHIGKEGLYREEITFTFEDLEDVYRQLKRNFENSKNWEISGLAYISEMEMRKHRLKEECRYGDFFIYWFYGFFGGYTQSFNRPIVILLFSMFVLFPLLYFLSDCFLMTIDFTSNSIPVLQKDYNLFCGNYFRKSIDSTFPFYKNTYETKFWWLQYSETLLNSILLTFSILALRKRFKQ